MPTDPDSTNATQVPLAVDLDGTLIRTDMLWESLARLLRQNPLAMFAVLFWWMRGRAHLKQQLAARVTVDASALPYHTEFLAWLKSQKQSGRKLILATASDIKMAEPVARHVGLFDEVLASDGKPICATTPSWRRSPRNSASVALITRAIPPWTSTCGKVRAKPWL